MDNKKKKRITIPGGPDRFSHRYLLSQHCAKFRVRMTAEKVIFQALHEK